MSDTVVVSGDLIPRADGLLEMLRTQEMAGSTCAMLTPAIRARLREMAPGQVLEMRVDDPAAIEDMASWTRLAGHELVQTIRDGEKIHFFVRKSRA